MASLAEIKVIMGTMSIAYPNYVAKQGAPEIYHMILSDIPKDALEAGAKTYLATSNAFFPSPGQWRQAALDVVLSNAAPSAMEAWGEVLRQIEISGYYREPEFSSPLIEKIVNQFGWQNLCSSENQVADRARFLQAYESALQTASSDARMLPGVKTVAEKYQLERVDESIKKLTEGMSHG
jgi:hypothetical protein